MTDPEVMLSTTPNSEFFSRLEAESAGTEAEPLIELLKPSILAGSPQVAEILAASTGLAESSREESSQ